MPTEAEMRRRAEEEIKNDPPIAPILNKVLSAIFDPEPPRISKEHFDLIAEKARAAEKPE